jgi:hypothetical protein
MFIAIKFLFSIVCEPFGVCHCDVCAATMPTTEFFFFYLPHAFTKGLVEEWAALL